MAKYGARYDRPSRRGSSNKVTIATRVSPEAWDHADAVARAHDVSLSALVAELLARMEVGPDNRLKGPLLTMPDRHPTHEGQQLDLSA